MLDTSVSADAQAVLLLCTTLGLARDVKPLSPGEWNRLAAALSERKMRPGDLLGRDATTLGQDASVDDVSPERLARLLERGGQLAFELERLAERGIWVLTRADGDYPSRWKERLKQSAPVVLFGAGPFPATGQRAMAIVGSRGADEAGLAFARRLAAACVDAGFAVVSGGARGTDAAALTECLESQGRACAVLADGLEQTLRKREMIGPVRDQRLTLLSVQHPAAHFSVGAAMGRNKLIYCLSDWATVVSTSAENGGTWAGATENLQRGWVPLFVRDEPDASEGNRRLLALGARPLGAAHIASGAALAEHLAATPLAFGSSAAPPVAREMTFDFGEADAGQPAAPDPDVHPDRDLPPEGGSHGLNSRFPAGRELGIENVASGFSRKAMNSGESSEPVIGTASVGATDELAAIDLYAVVLDRLVAFCAEPRTADEVAAAFSLERAQTKAWLTRAVSDKRLRKLTKPVRYRSHSRIQP
ncbi:MAG TPA: DNA-processing protein DprA [Vicinamibacterales bacterium]